MVMRVRAHRTSWTRVASRPMVVAASLAVVALVALLAPGSAGAGVRPGLHKVNVLPWAASDTWQDETAPVQGCDPLVTQPVTATSCLLPFPDDFLTVHDASTS